MSESIKKANELLARMKEIYDNASPEEKKEIDKLMQKEEEREKKEGVKPKFKIEGDKAVLIKDYEWQELRPKSPKPYKHVYKLCRMCSSRLQHLTINEVEMMGDHYCKKCGTWAPFEDDNISSDDKMFVGLTRYSGQLWMTEYDAEDEQTIYFYCYNHGKLTNVGSVIRVEGVYVPSYTNPLVLGYDMLGEYVLEKYGYNKDAIEHILKEPESDKDGNR